MPGAINKEVLLAYAEATLGEVVFTSIQITPLCRCFVMVESLIGMTSIASMLLHIPIGSEKDRFISKKWNHVSLVHSPAQTVKIRGFFLIITE